MCEDSGREKWREQRCVRDLSSHATGARESLQDHVLLSPFIFQTRQPISKQAGDWPDSSRHVSGNQGQMPRLPRLSHLSIFPSSMSKEGGSKEPVGRTSHFQCRMFSKASKCQGMPVKRVSAINNCNEGQGYSSGVGFCILCKALGLKVRNTHTCTHTNRTSIRVAHLRCNLKQDATALTRCFYSLPPSNYHYHPLLSCSPKPIHVSPPVTRFLISYHTTGKL